MSHNSVPVSLSTVTTTEESMYSDNEQDIITKDWCYIFEKQHVSVIYGVSGCGYENYRYKHVLQWYGEPQRQSSMPTHLSTIIFVIPPSQVENEKDFSLAGFLPLLAALDFQLTCLASSFSSAKIRTFGRKLLRHHLKYYLHLLNQSKTLLRMSKLVLIPEHMIYTVTHANNTENFTSAC